MSKVRGTCLVAGGGPAGTILLARAKVLGSAEPQYGTAQVAENAKAQKCRSNSLGSGSRKLIKRSGPITPSSLRFREKSKARGLHRLRRCCPPNSCNDFRRTEFIS